MKQVILSFLLLGAQVLYGQIPQAPANVPSPNAYEFAKYGNTSVNMFNGQPSIQVPLNMVQVGEFNLSASLGYDASGFRPDVFPSWVGRNWSLNIGGVLTRKVRGLPDEFDFTIASNYSYPNGFINRGSANTISEANLLKTYSPYYTGSCGGNMLATGLLLPYWPDNIYYMTPNLDGLHYGQARGEFWVGQSPDFFYLWNSGNSDGNGGGVQDMYPDEFTFNAFGVSGKFYFKKPGPYASTENWDDVFAVQCDQKVKIRPFYDQNSASHVKLYEIPLAPPSCGNQATTQQRYLNYSPWAREAKYPKVLAGFVITTEDGISLTFGVNALSTATSVEYFKQSVPIEISTSLYSCKDYWTADSWYLSQVELPGGKKIHFEYERDGFIASKYISVYDARINETVNFASCVDNEHSIGYKAGRIISPVYLKLVYGDDFQWIVNRSESTQLPMDIDAYPSTIFNYSTNGFTFNKRYKVDNIVFNNKGLTKVVNFTYDNTSSERLRLQSVLTTDGTNPAEKYQFSYIHDLAEVDYLSQQTDHWGFWNGSGVGPSTNYTQYYNSKEPNFYYAKQGLLSTMTYPTGGTTSFTYEPNSYSKQVTLSGVSTESAGGNKICGGARIKEMTDNDPVKGIQSKRRWYYINDFNTSLTETQLAAATSSGVLNAQVKYHWSDNTVGNSQTYHVTFSGDQCSYAKSSSTATLDVFSSQALYLIYDSYHIGYTKVYEVKEDNSYTMTEFTNHDNGFANLSYLSSFNPAFESPYNHCSATDFERGKIKTVKMFNSSNTAVQEKTIEYTRKLLADPSKNGYAIWDGVAFFSGGCGYSAYLDGFSYAVVGNQYTFETYQLVPSQEKDILYDQANSLRKIETTKDYSYQGTDYYYPTKIVTHNSKGEELTTLFKYSQDYPSVPIMNQITNAIPKTVVEQLNLKNDPAANTQKLVGGQLNEYASVSTDMPYLNTVYKLRLAAPIDYSFYTATVPVSRAMNSTTTYTKDSRYEPVATIARYDAYRNPLETIKSNGERSVNIMGNRGGNIIATTLPPTEEANHTSAYTSFERNSYFDNDGNATEGFDNESDFEYTGSWSFSDHFTGQNSFNGVAKYKSTIYGAYIYVVAKHGGNVPFVQAVINNTPNTGTPMTKIDEVDGWDVYMSSVGGANFYQVNSNNNYMDELRILGNNLGSPMMTYTYKNGLLSGSADQHFRRVFYEYDNFGRLSLVRDKNYNILKKFCYNYAGQVENCGLAPTCSNCTAANQKCINGACENGTKIYIATQYLRNTGWSCTYVYYWSDCSYSQTYTEINSSPCAIGTECSISYH
jgi:hypothetical protein